MTLFQIWLKIWTRDRHVGGHHLPKFCQMNFYWLSIATFVVWPTVFCRNVPVQEDGDVCSNDVDEASILQIQNGSNVASTLLHAKEVCVKGSSGCWESLSMYRIQMWHKVMADKPQWMPRSVFNHHDDAIGEVVCRGGNELVLFYRHIFKAAGHGVFANLKKIGKNTSISVNSPEICSSFDLGNPNHVHFTFAREPISRFAAAYAEIEHRVDIGEPWLVYKKMKLILAKHPRGSVKRAEAFFSEFLRSGIFGDGHVKPQSEYLGHIKDCDIPMHFIGAVENMSADWSRMLEHYNCQQDAYDDHEGLHPNDERDKNALVKAINTSSAHSFIDTQASVDIATQRLKDMDMASMETMLQSEPTMLLRLCWIYLPDFVIFEYDLPAACKEDKTLAAIVQQTQKWLARLRCSLRLAACSLERTGPCFRLRKSYVSPFHPDNCKLQYRFRMTKFVWSFGVRRMVAFLVQKKCCRQLFYFMVEILQHLECWKPKRLQMMPGRLTKSSGGSLTKMLVKGLMIYGSPGRYQHY